MASLDALEPATTYHYRLVALNGGGVGYGDDRTFATSTVAARPPAEKGLGRR